MLVLREDQRIRKRTDARAHIAEDHARDLSPVYQRLTAVMLRPRSTTVSASPI